MEALIGVPYQLYARQPETEQFRALNCFTAMIHALRRSGYRCPDLSFKQGWAYWWPQARVLRLGETPVSGKGALLLTRTHFLLMYADQNGDGLIDGDDRVIHAYYRPVEVSTLAEWMQANRPGEIRYLPLDESLACPTDDQLGRTRR